MSYSYRTQSENLQPLAFRWAFLVLLLAFEIAATTILHESAPFLLLAQDTAALLFYQAKEFWRGALWVAAACFLILTPRMRPIGKAFVDFSLRHPWKRIFLLHLAVFGAFAWMTVLIVQQPLNPSRFSHSWLLAWLGLAADAVLLWALAFAPAPFWRLLAKQYRWNVLLGVLLGLGAYLLVGLLVNQNAPLAQMALWDVLSAVTLYLVQAQLGLFYGDVVYFPETQIVGTDPFNIEITYACSGIEGITLICLFLAIYLWLFRRNLRFPNAFGLFPLGIAAIWLANTVRIALLIVIGTELSPRLALGGAHAQAGWIGFTVIAVAAISLSHRLRFFSRRPAQAASTETRFTLAMAFLIPWLALLAASMVTTALADGFDRFYPLRVLATGAALWMLRKHYRGQGWAWSWPAAGIGTAVFAMWILLEPAADPRPSPLAEAFAGQPGWVVAAWLAFRVLGSCVTVPLAEELAFRGYMLRKLVLADFASVPPRQLTWFAVMASSALFGLLHERLLAGTLAGMAYAGAFYRGGRLGDAVLAHAVTNAWIAVWVIVFGQWNLWG